MAFEAVNPPSFPPLLPVYSRGAKFGNFIQTSGVCAVDGDGKTVGVGDIRAQTRCVLDAIKTIVEAGGARMSDIYMVQIFIKSFDDYAGMNEVYQTYFGAPAPARFTVKADLLRDDWLVEIAATAFKD